MFIQKLFNTNNKITWALIDLLMIIIGVYCAFIIQKYAETQQTKKDKERVLSALKFELEEFRIALPDFAAYMDRYLEKNKNDPTVNFSGWRYSEPQYAYQIVEYAMNLENSEIVDFALYDKLQRLYVVIKQLEYSERSINRISEKYQSIVSELPNNHVINLERIANNKINWGWFRTYAGDRSSSLKRVANESIEALQIINDGLGIDKQKEIEASFMSSKSALIKSEAEAIELAKVFFPNFTEEEIRTLYQNSQNK